MLRFHAQTAGSSLTAQQPENNLVRVALQCLAAVLGGCQSLHANASTKRSRCPPSSSALLALRTQQIIAHETGVANTVDPVAGSYAIEKLTDEIEAGAQDYISTNRCAWAACCARSRRAIVQQEIQKSAYEYQQAVERGEQVVVGVNRYKAEEEQSVPTLRIDPEIERTQVARAESAARPPRCREIARRARGSRAPRPRYRKSDACDPRRRRSLRHRRRNLRRAPPRLRRIPRIRRDLISLGLGVLRDLRAVSVFSVVSFVGRYDPHSPQRSPLV